MYTALYKYVFYLFNVKSSKVNKPELLRLDELDPKNKKHDFT